MAERSGVIAAAALLPAGVLAIDPGGLSPYGPAKWCAVSTLAAVAALGLWRRPPRVEAHAAVAWGVLLGALCVSAAVGADRLYAWTGTPERNFGVAAWLLCALMFFVAHGFRPAERRRIATVAAVTGGAMGAWATAEALGWRPVEVAAGGGRLLGPLGSSAFLGAAATLLLPIAFGCSLDAARSRRLRGLAGGAAALCGVGLVGAGARAAWLGVAVVGCVAAVLHRRWLRTHRSVVVVIFSAVGVALVLTGLALGVGSRLSGALDETTGGGSSRLAEWRVAARVVARHPLGVGPEGYRIAFGAAVDASYERRYGREVVPDRAHDVLLDVALAAGLPGAAAYVALVAVVGRHLLRALRHGPALEAGIAAGVLAYWVQELFLFPIAVLEPGVWLLAGLVVAAVAPPSGLRALRPPRIAAVAVAGVGVVALVAGARDVLADRQARVAMGALERGRVSTAEQHADDAVSLRPDVVRYRLLAARAHAASATVEGDRLADEQLSAAARISPADPALGTERATFLLERARRTTAPADVHEAETYLLALVRRDPRNAELQLRLGVASALAGSDADAARAWLAAEYLAPHSASPAVDLAELYARQGRWAEAVAAAGRALRRDPASEPARRVLEAAAEHGT